jgi:hypothetical protein
MNNLKALLLTGIALLTVSFAGAETRVHPIGVEVTFPDAWVAEIEEDDLFLSEEDESAAVMIMVIDAEDVELAAEDATDELAAWVDNPKITAEGEEGNINGLAATYVEGTGTMNGVAANWLVVYIVYEGDIIMVAGWGESAEWDPKTGDVVDIIQSIQEH